MHIFHNNFTTHLVACAAKTNPELLKRRRELRLRVADAMSELSAVETELARRKGGQKEVAVTDITRLKMRKKGPPP
jgi:hypothetical protein